MLCCKSQKSDRRGSAQRYRPRLSPGRSVRQWPTGTLSSFKDFKKDLGTSKHVNDVVQTSLMSMRLNESVEGYEPGSAAVPGIP